MNSSNDQTTVFQAIKKIIRNYNVWLLPVSIFVVGGLIVQLMYIGIGEGKEYDCVVDRMHSTGKQYLSLYVECTFTSGGFVIVKYPDKINSSSSNEQIDYPLQNGDVIKILEKRRIFSWLEPNYYYAGKSGK